MRYGYKLKKEEGKKASGTYYQTICPSPVGTLTLACDGESLVGLWIEGQKYYGGAMPEAMAPKDDLPVFTAAKKWLEQYFSGEKPSVSELPLAPSAVLSAKACGAFCGKSPMARCSPMAISQKRWLQSWEGNGCPARR